MDADVHYFDHATTSTPKVNGVADAIAEFYESVCVSPARSGHRLADTANNILAKARKTACDYFGSRSPHHIAFTSGATESLNLVLQSLLKPGDEVVVSSFDHNASIRPIARLCEKGVTVRIAKFKSSVHDLVESYAECFNERTRLAVVTQASNVDGTVVPVAEIAARAKGLGIPVLVDGAQSSGWLDRDELCQGADFFATSLHKGLGGPFGLGVLVVRIDDAVLQPLQAGGTGLESWNPIPQSVIPNGLEAGTINAPAIAGAIPALEYALSTEAKETVQKVLRLFRLVLEELALLRHIRAFGPVSQKSIVPVVSLQHGHIAAAEFARVLDRKYGILTRAGLHCAPRRHQDLGTYPDGTVRVSFGHYTNEENTNALILALQDLDRVNV